MESPVTLTANNKDDLNKQIDQKLKEGYLLHEGGMREGDDGTYIQHMTLPNNIDSEFTMRGAIKLAIFLPLYIALLYFIL